MNTYYSFDEPLVLKPTAADLMADWYWANRPALARTAILFVAGVVVTALAVAVI